MTINVFDIEAREWVNVFLVGFYDGVNVRYCDNIKEFLEFIPNLPHRSVLYAHFGGGYDFRFIINELLDTGQHPYDMIIQGNKLIRFKVKFKSKVIEFRDSYAILPRSLRELTKSFKVEHKKQEIDYKNEKDINVWKEYLEYDLKGLHQVITAFKKLLKTDLRLTIASQSMHEFNKDRTVEIPYNRYIEERVRLGYVGGRCEVFKLKGENLTHYDFNSCYPAVMKDGLFPTGSLYASFDSYKDKEGVFFAKIEAPDINIPFLWTKLQDKLVFPVGKWAGWYVAPELRFAEKLGYKIEVIEGMVCDQNEKIFNEYVSYWYAKKLKAEQEGDDAGRFIAKLMLNVLYGKFGQIRERRKVFFKESFTEGDIIPDIDLGLCSKTYLTKFSRFIYPMISAYVTGYARIKLYQSMQQAGLDNVYYVDTDCIITDKKLPTSNKLGELKIEAKIKKAIFLAPKLYAYKTNEKDIMKAKGFNVEQLEYSNYEKGVIETSKECFVGWLEAPRRGKKWVDRITRPRVYAGVFNKRHKISEVDTKPLNMGKGIYN